MSSSLNHQIIDNEGVPHETIEGSGAANKEAASESSEGTMITVEEMLLFMGKECLRTCAEDAGIEATRSIGEILKELLAREGTDAQQIEQEREKVAFHLFAPKLPVIPRREKMSTLNFMHKQRLAMAYCSQSEGREAEAILDMVLVHTRDAILKAYMGELSAHTEKEESDALDQEYFEPEAWQPLRKRARVTKDYDNGLVSEVASSYDALQKKRLPQNWKNRREDDQKFRKRTISALYSSPRPLTSPNTTLSSPEDETPKPTSPVYVPISPHYVPSSPWVQNEESFPTRDRSPKPASPVYVPISPRYVPSSPWVQDDGSFSTGAKTPKPASPRYVISSAWMQQAQLFSARAKSPMPTSPVYNPVSPCYVPVSPLLSTCLPLLPEGLSPWQISEMVAADLHALRGNLDMLSYGEPISTQDNGEPHSDGPIPSFPVISEEGITINSLVGRGSHGVAESQSIDEQDGELFLVPALGSALVKAGLKGKDRAREEERDHSSDVFAINSKLSARGGSGHDADTVVGTGRLASPSNANNSDVTKQIYPTPRPGLYTSFTCRGVLSCVIPVTGTLKRQLDENMDRRRPEAYWRHDPETPTPASKIRSKAFDRGELVPLSLNVSMSDEVEEFTPLPFEYTGARHLKG